MSSSKKCTAIYEEQLCMKVGTAQARLLKMLLFKFAAEGSECHKCGEIIDSYDAMSIDHITPWRNEPTADLFWDLENIAFTHKWCNKTDRPTSLRKIGPEGTAWCAVHKEFLPVKNFGFSSSHWNGYQSMCLECGREKTRRYAEQNSRFPCPECGKPMRKRCQNKECGYELPMKDYMALRRKEGVTY